MSMDAHEEETTLEEDFEELQCLLAEKDEANDKIERLQKAAPGDEEYDDIFAEMGGDEAQRDVSTRAMLEQLVADWNEHHDKLDDRESELFDRLSEAGYDIKGFYEETLVRPVLDLAASSHSEHMLFDVVSSALDQIRPVERQHGNVSERRSVGASGHDGTEEEIQELGEVDILDDAAEPMLNDKLPDRMQFFAEKDDVQGVEDPSQASDTGAMWYNGFRLPLALHKACKPHQLELVFFLLDSWQRDGGALAAHSMGLGKSFSFLAAIETYTAKHPGTRAVMACPKTMVQVWSDEVQKWDQQLTRVVVHALFASDNDASMRRVCRTWKLSGGLLVVGHDQFRKIVDELAIDEAVVFAVDEAHALKSTTTNFYATVAGVATNKRTFLTGTPLQNHLDEYYAMIELLAPGLLGRNATEFRKLYGSAIEQGMLKDSTPAQVSKCERTVQVLRWRIEHVMQERSAALLREAIPPKTEFRVSHPCLSVCTDSNPIVERHNVQVAARTHKIMTTVAIIDAILSVDPTDAIIVFSTRVENLRLIQNNRDGPLFTGQSSSELRIKLIDDFQSNGGIIYITTQAGGAGITLTRANHVILVDASWNPVHDAQAACRAWRMGQTKPVFVYRLIAERTLEERIYRLGIQKHALAARVLEETDVNRLFTRQDLIALTESEEQYSPLDAFAIASNAVLSKIAGLGLTFYNHDALFSEQDATLSDDDQIRARNDLNGVIATQPRTLYTADGVTQTIPPGQAYFFMPYDEELVPAYTPYYSAVNGSVINFDKCGPLPTFDMQFKIVTESLDESDDSQWMDTPAHADGNSLCINVQTAGTYVFRVRSRVDSGVTVALGPWSDESVPIVIA